MHKAGPEERHGPHGTEELRLCGAHAAGASCAPLAYVCTSHLRCTLPAAAAILGLCWPTDFIVHCMLQYKHKCTQHNVPQGMAKKFDCKASVQSPQIADRAVQVQQQHGQLVCATPATHQPSSLAQHQHRGNCDCRHARACHHTAAERERWGCEWGGSQYTVWHWYVKLITVQTKALAAAGGPRRCCHGNRVCLDCHSNRPHAVCPSPAQQIAAAAILQGNKRLGVAREPACRGAPLPRPSTLAGELQALPAPAGQHQTPLQEGTGKEGVCGSQSGSAAGADARCPMPKAVCLASLQERAAHALSGSSSPAAACLPAAAACSATAAAMACRPAAALPLPSAAGSAAAATSAPSALPFEAAPAAPGPLTVLPLSATLAGAAPHGFAAAAAALLLPPAACELSSAAVISSAAGAASERAAGWAGGAARQAQRVC